MEPPFDPRCNLEAHVCSGPTTPSPDGEVQCGCTPIPAISEPCGTCPQHRPFLDDGQPLAPDYVIAPWWNDWKPNEGSTVTYGRLDANLANDRFVVAWNDVTGPTGGTYSFEVKLFKDGRIEYHYKKVSQEHHGADSDFGRQGSVGMQPRRGAHYADSVFFCQGAPTPDCPDTPLLPATALRFDPDTTQRPESGAGDPDVPQVVQDFAPDFYLDYSDNGTCDTAITRVDFDGDFCGANNNGECGPVGAGAPLTHVYYSLSETQTHYFIGYYLYHQQDCTGLCYGGGWSQGHEHDVEGVNLAVRKDLMRVEAAFTNAHGNKVSYVPVYSATEIVDTSPDFGSHHTRHLTFVPKRSPSPHSRVALGVEARTHSVWGRWDERCVIGRNGAPSGCSGDAGGDGLILSYDRNDPTARDASLLSRPQYPAWQKTTYRLLAIESLLGKASNPAYSGDACSTGNELFSVNNSPWRELQYYGTTLNGCGEDAGQLPWVWGRSTQLTLGHPCEPEPTDPQARRLNVLTDAASVFDALFLFGSTFYLPATPWHNGLHTIVDDGGIVHHVQVADGYQANPYESVDHKCCTNKVDPYHCYD